MKTIKPMTLLVILLATITLFGCQSVPMGQQSDVAIVDAKGRAHV